MENVTEYGMEKDAMEAPDSLSYWKLKVMLLEHLRRAEGMVRVTHLESLMMEQLECVALPVYWKNLLHNLWSEGEIVVNGYGTPDWAIQLRPEPLPMGAVRLDGDGRNLVPVDEQALGAQESVLSQVRSDAKVVREKQEAKVLTLRLHDWWFRLPVEVQLRLYAMHTLGR